MNIVVDFTCSREPVTHSNGAVAVATHLHLAFYVTADRVWAMQVSAVEVAHFCRYSSRRRVTFPTAGLTLVTAPNGAGKSTLCVESVVWCLWGETVRGSTPRPPGAAPTDVTFARVEFSHLGVDYEAERTFNGKATTFRWGRVGFTETRYETNTKAQVALEQVIGPKELWVATSLFAADDAAMFSRATDSARKKLLERLLGVEHLDAAADRSRKLQTGLKAKHSMLVSKLSRAEGVIGQLEDNIQRLLLVGGVVSSGGGEEDLPLLTGELTEAQKTYQTTQATLSRAKLEAEAAKREIVRVLDGKCLACNQEVPKALLERQYALAHAAEQKFQEQAARVTQDLDLLSKRILLLTGKVQSARALAAQQQVVASYAGQLEQFEDQLGDLYLEQAQLNVDVSTLLEDLEVQEHVVRVLGSRGVRAKILQKTLSSIAKLANTYLTWLSPGIRIRLLPFTTTKTGTTNEQFQLLVEEAGGSDYLGASGGERRRIDIALVLALAQLRKSDMLIVDDLFDALDKAGARAASQLLLDIARRRSVVVLTHDQNEEFVEAVKAVAGQVITP